MENLVELQNLTKIYDGSTIALNQISLTIPRGKIIGLLGPNGSGKTTLIKILNGLLSLSSGSALINGNHPGIETKKIVAYLPDKFYLPDNMRVHELVEMFNDFYDNFDKERAYSMLSSLGIESHLKMKSLSKGTKEKVQLILVMSRRAELYILDEPIAGVDPAARDYILRTIITNYDENATILLSTHLISDIEKILDDVIFIKNGEILLCSTVEQIRETHGKSIDTYFREVFAC